MGYLLTPTGFDAMNVLGEFSKRMGEFGPSPTELELSFYDIKSGLRGQRMASMAGFGKVKTLYGVLEDMSNPGLLEYSPG